MSQIVFGEYFERVELRPDPENPNEEKETWIGYVKPYNRPGEFKLAEQQCFNVRPKKNDRVCIAEYQGEWHIMSVEC